MQLQRSANQRHTIAAYDENGIVINQQRYQQSIWLSSQQVVELPLKLAEVSILTAAQLPLDEQVELLIIGGNALSPLSTPSQLQYELFQQGISLEVMALSAACRTFNLLLDEGRPVASLILF